MIMAMTRSPSRAPTLVARLAPILLASAALAQSVDPDCDARASIAPVRVHGVLVERVLLDQPYGPHSCQRLDAFLVESPEPAPVLIDVHGGGWSAGRKSEFYRVPIPAKAQDLMLVRALEAGFSVISVDYRLAALKDGCCKAVKDATGQAIPDFQHVHPVPLDDVARAIQFARAMGRSGDWNVDPHRVGGIGTSAGGNLLLQACLTPDRIDPQSTDPVERESSHLDGTVAFVAPTLLSPDTWWSCGTPASIPEQWVFGGADPATFNTDPSLLPVKLGMSPAWLARQPPPIGIGRQGVRSAAVLGVYGGDPSWTAQSFTAPSDPCSATPPDPLWRPTPDLHSALHGILLFDALSAQGSTAARLLVDPKNGCASMRETRADRMLGWAAGWLGHFPHEDLSHLEPGKLGLNGLRPELGGYGRIRPGRRASLFAADASAASRAWLVWSPSANPQTYLGGTLWPDLGTAVFTQLDDTDDCGHLSWAVPDGFFPTGDVFAQLVIEEIGNTFDTLLSHPIRLIVEP